VAAFVSVEGSSQFSQDPAAAQDGIVEQLKNAGKARVESIIHGSRTQVAPLPYTTARLQQDGARYLGFSVKHTMRAAQALFESANSYLHSVYRSSDSSYAS
jgi:DNA topoisomerase I